MQEDEKHIKEILIKGSLKSFKILVEKYENRVFTLCYKIIKNREDAEEVAQDVFVTVYKKLKNLKEKNKFPNWIMKIAYSKSIDFTRKKRVIKIELNQVNEQYLKVEQTPINNVIDQDRQQILKKAINSLEAEEASVITLYYMDDLPIKEIAEITGLSLSNVKIKLFRGRNALKAIIYDHLETDFEDFIQN